MLETLNHFPFVYLRNYFTEQEAQSYTDLLKTTWKFWNAPSWLGTFKFSMHKMEDIKLLPVEARGLFFKLSRLCKEQGFNTLFVQKYEIGQEVKSHQDPKNNTGCTILAHFGEWNGGILNIRDPYKREGYTLQTNPGDVIILRCNMNGLIRPQHWVTSIESGTKYSFILNTIG